MPTETADTMTDTATDNRPVSGWARAALAAPTALVGAASFVESFHGLFDLMQRVEQTSTVLAAVGPIGVDGLQLVSLAGTVVARRAPARTRIYMWTAFLGANAVSVAGNMIDAQARHLSAAGIAIAGLWPVLLAAASHIVVVSSRLLEAPRPATATQAPSEPPPRVLAEQDGEDEPEREQTSAPTDAQLRARARTRYKAGVSCRQISADLRAQGLDVSEKKVERWTTDLRPARKAPTADTEPAEVPTTGELEPAT